MGLLPYYAKNKFTSKFRPNIIFGVVIINELGSVFVTLLDSLKGPCSKIVLK